MLTLTEVMEYMKDGYNITEFITIREGNKESKKSEFLAYFYTKDNSKGRWLAISNCILEDFENYLSVHKPEFIDEFSLILAQRKLEQE